MADDNPHVVGPSAYRSPHARFETKPSPVYRDWVDRNGDRKIRRDSGGGYERVRSWEYDPRLDTKRDAYAAIHRLCAVAWLLPPDAPLSALDGMDVHHSAPEVEADRGIEWDNREDCLSLKEHGRHSEITQAQMRAWAEDAKRRVEREQNGEHLVERCERCSAEADTFAESDDWSGRYCLDCALAASEGAPIRIEG